VGIGIQKTNAGIGIPASVISVRYRTKICRTAQFFSGTGLFPVSLVFAVRYRISGMPDNPVFRHCSVAEPHHHYAAQAPGKNFDVAPAVPAPTLLHYIRIQRFKMNKKLFHFSFKMFLK
jgi:hypothetical protein